MKPTKLFNMAKINKFANLYDKDGNLLRKAPLTPIDIPELEKMIDDYKGDKSSREYTNLVYSLMALYDKYGNPHQQELIDRINEYGKTNNLGNDERAVRDALEDLSATLTEDETTKPDEVPSYDVNSRLEDYVEPIND